MCSSLACHKILSCSFHSRVGVADDGCLGSVGCIHVIPRIVHETRGTSVTHPSPHCPARCKSSGRCTKVPSSDVRGSDPLTAEGGEANTQANELTASSGANPRINALLATRHLAGYFLTIRHTSLPVFPSEPARTNRGRIILLSRLSRVEGTILHLRQSLSLHISL